MMTIKENYKNNKYILLFMEAA